VRPTESDWLAPPAVVSEEPVLSMIPTASAMVRAKVWTTSTASASPTASDGAAVAEEVADVEAESVMARVSEIARARLCTMLTESVMPTGSSSACPWSRVCGPPVSAMPTESPMVRS
jgi:hypothetical protein